MSGAPGAEAQNGTPTSPDGFAYLRLDSFQDQIQKLLTECIFQIVNTRVGPATSRRQSPQAANCGSQKNLLFFLFDFCFCGSPRMSSKVAPVLAPGWGEGVALLAMPTRFPVDTLRAPRWLLDCRGPRELLLLRLPKTFGGSIGTGSRPMAMLERHAELARFMPGDRVRGRSAG